MAPLKKRTMLEEAIDFALNSNNSDCDFSVGDYRVTKKMTLIVTQKIMIIQKILGKKFEKDATFCF